MFGKIKNIDTAFRSVRLFCITVVCCSFLLCLVVIFLSFQQTQRLQDRMYVLAGDKVIEAYASDLERLGKKFETFSRLKDLTMEWSAHPGT